MFSIGDNVLYLKKEDDGTCSINRGEVTSIIIAPDQSISYSFSGTIVAESMVFENMSREYTTAFETAKSVLVADVKGGGIISASGVV